MSRLALVLALVIGAAACRPTQEEPVRRAVIRLVTGPQGGGFFPLGEQVASALSGLMPDVEVKYAGKSLQVKAP